MWCRETCLLLYGRTKSCLVINNLVITSVLPYSPLLSAWSSTLQQTFPFWWEFGSVNTQTQLTVWHCATLKILHQWGWQICAFEEVMTWGRFLLSQRSVMAVSLVLQPWEVGAMETFCWPCCLSGLVPSLIRLPSFHLLMISLHTVWLSCPLTACPG